MSDNRLIINTRGETFKAIRDDDSVSLQCSTLYDRVTETGSNAPHSVFISETAFSFHDVRGIIIQLANAIGDAVELVPLRTPVRAKGSKPSRLSRYDNDRRVSDGSEYVLKCITPNT